MKQNKRNYVAKYCYDLNKPKVENSKKQYTKKQRYAKIDVDNES